MSPYSSNWGPQLLSFHPGAFRQNDPGTLGNLARDALRGPAQVNLDVSVGRVFAITERYRLEARVEAFKAINHTNFNLPKTSTVGVTDIDAVTLPFSAASRPRRTCESCNWH